MKILIGSLLLFASAFSFAGETVQVTGPRIPFSPGISAGGGGGGSGVDGDFGCDDPTCGGFEPGPDVSGGAVTITEKGKEETNKDAKKGSVANIAEAEVSF